MVTLNTSPAIYFNKNDANYCIFVLGRYCQFQKTFTREFLKSGTWLNIWLKMATK